jgi:hypothetical protein
LQHFPWQHAVSTPRSAVAKAKQAKNRPIPRRTEVALEPSSDPLRKEKSFLMRPAKMKSSIDGIYYKAVTSLPKTIF